MFIYVSVSTVIAILLNLALSSAKTQNNSVVTLFKVLRDAARKGMCAHVEESNVSNSQDLTNFNQLLIDSPISPEKRHFYLHGWRWHCISLIRDLDRINALVDSIHNKNVLRSIDSKASLKYDEKLRKGFQFVVDFNMKALFAVECEIILPWLSNILPPSLQPLIVERKRQHSDMQSLTSKLRNVCNSYAISTASYGIVKSILSELSISALKLQKAQV